MLFLDMVYDHHQYTQGSVQNLKESLYCFIGRKLNDNCNLRISTGQTPVVCLSHNVNRVTRWTDSILFLTVLIAPEKVFLN